MAHRLIRPSSNAWWTACLGGPALVAKLGLKYEQSEWAAEGDALHAIAASCLEFEIDPVDMAGAVRGGTTLSVKDARLMQEVYGWWQEQGFERQGFEETLACDSVYPGRRGVVDAWGLVGDTITVLDWKWGRGVPVSPEENLQMIEYAYAVWTERVWNLFHAHDRADPKRIKFRLCIAQPRITPGVQEWETTLHEIVEKIEWMKSRAKIAMERPDPPLTPGPEQCRLCDAAENDRCDARHRFLSETIAREPVTNEERAEIWARAAMIKKWLGQINARLIDDCRRGEGPAAVKAVLGAAGDRKWRDPEAAKAWLTELIGDAAMKVDLRSPTQVEDEIPPSKLEEFKALVARDEAKPILVPATDKRPALAPLEDMLEDYDE